MPGPHYRETWVDDTNVNKTTLRNGMRDQTALLVTVAELQAMDTAAHRFAVVKTGTGEVAIFEYDAADAATADNGTTVLVSNDGNRFKRSSIYSAQVDYSIDVQKDDADVATSIAQLNFEGAGVAVADDGSGKATVTIAGGGGEAPFQLSNFVNLTSQITIPAGAILTITWQNEALSSGDFFDITSPTRFTVPAGVSQVLLWAFFQFTDVPGFWFMYFEHFSANGTSKRAYPATDAGGQYAAIASGPVFVETGDYFVFSVFSTNANTSWDDPRNYMAITKIG